MPTQTVPMLAPDGTSGDIPLDGVDAATKAGFQRAINMTSPEGKTGYIPEGRQQEALSAGFKPTAVAQPGFGSRFADASGLSALVHPLDTIMGLPGAVMQMGRDTVSNVQQGVRDYRQEGLTQQTRRDFGRAVPVLGPALATAQADADTGNYGGMAGTLAGTVVSLAGPKALKDLKPVVGEAVSGAKARIYPTSQSVVPAEAAARNLGKALVVPTQAMPNFIDAATEEAGTIRAYAKANNLPINSTVDLGKAAEATAQAVQDHFNNEILAPNAREVVSVPSDYRGTKLNVEGSRATVGEINNRINAINQEMSPNYRKATQMQTNAANVSDAELIAEKRKLTSILHDALAEKTGLEPEDIAGLRQKAGKLRSIADEVKLSANTNTTAAGKAAMGRSDIPTGTKLGMAERLLQTIRGGPEVIGNRAVNKALRDIDPTELVLPNPRR